ncbi:hypothetical protein PPERSA_05039 [Pseudocohnilembus persalinus]|uniref:Transmembrane protein n=1 Tax=Pseudocohnilembus persalinus TaxID=266149 RepID=A0A0V0QWK4_PSEPJ|nr:hypothetical protein PPERSA_05039 [Pseudocohnilembus persalinus]|eukprot:KRX06426.1 hypothetical protein PPERSA_05039 [Pseudocohnilembus persalinus]
MAYQPDTRFSQIQAQQLQQEENIPPFPKMKLQDFEEEQIKYLEDLARYSGRRSKLSFIDGKSSLIKKETYITEQFTYLDVNEQVNYNDLKMFMQNQKTYSYYVGGFTFLALMGYYTVTVPTARSLFKEFAKSLTAGTFAGYGYYKIRDAQYQDKMHKYYLMVLNRVNDRRRFHLTNKEE